MNQRQSNAQLTKTKVSQTAIKLFELKGFVNITVDEICAAAGVSTGTFYNVFKSKNDILNYIFEKVDTYFEEVVQPATQSGSIKERILLFFDFYADYNVQNGIRFTKSLYAVQSPLFIKLERGLLNVLRSLLADGVASQTLLLPMDIDDAVAFLLIHVRGIAYHWCLHDGKSDIRKTMHTHVEQLIKPWLV